MAFLMNSLHVMRVMLHMQHVHDAFGCYGGGEVR
jgi:hypothetical protein